MPATSGPLPADYLERVYAGVLGKIIGVYLGRPFEGWSHERIMRELGEIDGYVHDRVGVPLIVTDDDITGTFTFAKALVDHGAGLDLTAEQIGQTWLDAIVENRAILWWGGFGNSTEHTAFLRLKRGIPAPRSGSMQLNGQVVAEQIGAQIFIDAWAMMAPGQPDVAADLAGKAGSVSHDGEAVAAARALAAMEAQAFVEPDLQVLLDVAMSYLPADSVLAAMVTDLRRWRAEIPDWRAARDLLDESYGYHRYGGNCHVIPNHGLIVLALLYGDDDFAQSLRIVNTCGWDTDCNSGNVGALLGIKNGLAGVDAGPDWRGPVADRLYLPTADGGSSVTDAVRESVRIANAGRSLVGEPPLAPKGGARFHFELPGSVQGFTVDGDGGTPDGVRLDNVVPLVGHGARALRASWGAAGTGRTFRLMTPTFVPPRDLRMRGYELLACPTLYPGQRVRAGVSAASDVAPACRLVVRHYDGADGLRALAGPVCRLAPGERAELTFTVPRTGGQPVAEVGLEVERGTDAGSVDLHELTWDGEPDVVLRAPADGGLMWHRAWVNAVDQFRPGAASASPPESYRLMQNDGRGLLIHGTRDWRDYRAAAGLRPHLASAVGLAVRVRGLRRYVAVVLGCDGVARLVRHDFEGERVLAEQPMRWELGRSYAVEVEAVGDRVLVDVDGDGLFDVADAAAGLDGGGIALLCDEGRLGVDAVAVTPAG